MGQRTDRRRMHKLMGGRVFIPPERMGQIRWEESVLRSMDKREGVSSRIVHDACGCGATACLGAPMRIRG